MEMFRVIITEQNQEICIEIQDLEKRTNVIIELEEDEDNEFSLGWMARLIISDLKPKYQKIINNK